MNIISFKTKLGWITAAEENDQITSIKFGKKKLTKPTIIEEL